MLRPFYLAIEGVIGVGKTALARLLQPRFQANLLLEVFEENPFLSDFYADRERYAFQTQIFFLLSRYRQQQDIRVLDRPLIADYTFAKDRLFAHLNLKGDELATYELLHQALAEKVVLPDLVVYLQADLDVLMARIAMRDRPYERGIDPDYIESLRQAYERHFACYTATPLLIINTNNLDFVRNPQDLAFIEGQIRTTLEAIQESPPQTRVLEEGRISEDILPSRSPVEEFLALTEAVGLLGAALAVDSVGQAPATHQALARVENHLRRIQRLLCSVPK
ncbi:MAG: deoxynucleoside kinase [Anaerolineae bacterium]|nr:deoxynucleoside kinase [Anaerolineae bacterium]MCX8068792.1 deoxynucleoside kinase [Anaerolineae bacterium]MDW7990734.1 deoxynucleoside kinase [Anaerolineae bacterium]